MDTETRHYVSSHGNVLGPFQLQEIIVMSQKGQFEGDLSICEEGTEIWKPLTLPRRFRRSPKKARTFLYVVLLIGLLTLGVVYVVSEFQRNTDRIAAAQATNQDKETERVRGLESEISEYKSTIVRLEGSVGSLEEEARKARIQKSEILSSLEEGREKLSEIRSVAESFGDQAALLLIANSLQCMRPEKIRVRYTTDESPDFNISEKWMGAVVDPILVEAGIAQTDVFPDSYPWDLNIVVRKISIREGVNTAYAVDTFLLGSVLRDARLWRVVFFKDGVVGYAGANSDYYTSIRSTLTRQVRGAIAAIGRMSDETDEMVQAKAIIAKMKEVGLAEEFSNDNNHSESVTGSGILLSPKHVLTNAHVVGGASEILVYSDVEEPAKEYRATLLFSDEKSDLSLIELSSALPIDLPGVTAATPKQISLGEEIYAFGFPLASLMGTGVKFTQGTISGEEENGFIQISSPIQPGSSGSALFLESGELCGIVTATLDPSAVFSASQSLPQNVNYAVPISKIQAFLAENNLAELIGIGNASAKPFQRGDARRLAVRLVVH